jgi:RHS repeat-associated protein
VDPSESPAASITTAEGTTQIEYDPRHRVRQIAYPASSGWPTCGTACERFAYDRAGNRTLHQKDGAVRRAVIDAADQLVALTDDAGATTLESFAYDGAGRRTSHQVAGGATTQYGYDGLGRLTSLSRPGYAMTLTYTAAGDRRARTATGDSASFLGSWYETRPGGAVRLIPGAGGLDEVAAEVTSAGSHVRTLLADGTGNVTHVAVDGTPEPSPRRYEAFGALRSGTSIVQRGFAGQPFEGASGLVYLRARHYDPATGRFLQTDPLGIEADHLYVYARNNPLAFADPTGLDAWSLTGSILSGQSTIAGIPVHLRPADPGLWDSFWGKWGQPMAAGIQATFGLGEMVGAAALATTCATGLGCVAAAALATHGFDQFQTGLRSGFSGQSMDSMFFQGFQALGAGREVAGYLDIGFGAMSGVGAARSALGLGARASARSAPFVNIGPSAYSVAYETSIARSGVGTRAAHFRAANEDLRLTMSVDPEFAAAVERLVFRNRNCFDTSDLPADLADGRRPAEGLCVFVPLCDVLGDRAFEATHAIEASASDGLAGDHREPALHEFQPRGAGGREVDVEAGMGREPVVDLRMLVRAVVVADQVDLAPRVALGDRVEKRDELDVRVAREATAMNLPARHLERRKQAGGSVALVVVGHAGGNAGTKRQDRLGAIERLDLRLLVHRQHQRPLRRIEVQADDVRHLAVELGIAAELEGLDPMRLQVVLLPDALHRHVAEADLAREAPGAPVRAGLGRPHRGRDHGTLLRRADLTRPPRPGPRLEPGQTLLAIAAAPGADRVGGDLEPARRGPRPFPCGTRQDDPRAQRPRLRQGRRAEPPLQRGPIDFGNRELRSHVRHAG